LNPALLLALVALAAPETGRLELQRFDLVFTPRAEGTAALLSRTIEAERDKLARRLGRDWGGRTLVLIGDGPDEVAAMAPAGVEPPRWAAGMAFSGQNTLLFDARALRADTGRQLLLHEMAHLALGRAAPGAWPRWFQEGFAILVAGEWSMSRYAATYRASLGESAIPLSALERGWPDRLSQVEVAYAQSYSFVSHIYEKGGEATFRSLIDKVAEGVPFAEAFRSVYGVGLEEEEQAWRETLSSRFSWIPLVTSNATLWALISALFIFAYLRVRRRRRLRLEAMELEEQAKEAALRIVMAEAERAAAAAAAAESASARVEQPSDDDDEEPPRTVH
jgi:hypothetical protein